MKTIEQIQEIINGMQLNNIPLMNKNEADKVVAEDYVYTRANCVDKMSSDFFIGKDMHTYAPRYGDPTYWNYTNKSVEKEIKDDSLYKVWFTYHDSADPCDSTTSYCVYYVEEVPIEKRELISFLIQILKQLQS